MRYEGTENTVLAGRLASGGTVRIRLDDMKTNQAILLDDNNCTESTAIEGMYYWNTDDQIPPNTHVLYEMYDGDGKSAYGKLVTGGYVDNTAELLTKTTTLNNTINGVKVEILDKVVELDTTLDSTKTEVINKAIEAGINRIDVKDEIMAGITAQSVDITNNIEGSITNLATIVQTGNDDIRQVIEDVQLGSWELASGQMIMKTQAGDELARFNLTDQYGNPNMKSVFKRERV